MQPRKTAAHVGDDLQNSFRSADRLTGERGQDAFDFRHRRESIVGFFGHHPLIRLFE